MGSRKIIGVQLHHPIKLADARRFGANLCSAVEAARRITDNPALLALHDHEVAGLAPWTSIGPPGCSSRPRPPLLHGGGAWAARITTTQAGCRCALADLARPEFPRVFPRSQCDSSAEGSVEPDQR